MSVLWQVVIGLVLGSLYPGWLIIQDRCRHRAHMKRVRERVARREREDLAWSMWCRSAGDAIRNSRDVPRWPG